MDEGVDVRGYFYWTLADTYEWNEGYTAHFGLIGINRQTQERTPRQSARFFKDVIEENGVSTELVRKHLESPEK
jgi:beta-glucosidase